MSGLSRRGFLRGAAMLGSLTACGRAPELIDPVEPVPEVAVRLASLERKHNALVGVYAVALDSGRDVAYRDGDRFAMCSTFKTYAAARVLQMSAEGGVRLSDEVFIDPGALVSYSPVTEPAAGGSMSLAQLCEAALQRSDNTAANLLLTTIGGPPAVTAFARSIGDEQTRLDRWETELNAAVPGDPRDTSTPRALGGGYRNLLTGTALGEPQRAQLEAWMRGNTTSVKSLRAGLPPGWTAADKTGAGDYGSTNAVGIAYGPDGRRLLLSMMTRSQLDDPDAAMLQPLIAEVSALLVAELR